MGWLAAGREVQDQLVPVLAARKGAPENSLEVRRPACALLDAIGVAMERWAWQDEPEDVAELTRPALHCLRIDELWPGGPARFRKGRSCVALVYPCGTRG
ncbi:hypothetical protein DDE74_33640 [Streptomyces lydicus]|uniref:MftR C-terminal domain-containing protein n=2 Tax=Streptomyces lydicus TaxID=47763 RepID=A0A3Q9KE25_9ACTN|nr:hypothetical protein DDE74_33640 [Streptomyces lydicus]